MSGSHFIVQTGKFLLINATAVTLSQGHGKVIQYIFPDLYFLCLKCVSFSSNSFDVRSKIVVAADMETNWPQTGVT